jgi:hypothetical protein
MSPTSENVFLQLRFPNHEPKEVHVFHVVVGFGVFFAGIKPRVLYILGKFSTTEAHS